MGLASQILRSTVKRSWNRMIGKLGERFVSGLADTSADAPDAFYEPKRDLYREMVHEREVSGAPKDR